MAYNPQNMQGRLINPPFILHWAGWTADSLSLNRAGWEIQLNEKNDPYGFYISLRFPNQKAYGRSNFIQLEDLRREYNTFNNGRGLEIGASLELAQEIKILEQQKYPMGGWELDPNPSISHNPMRTYSVSEIFKPPSISSENILLKEVSLLEVLEVARSKQEPMQAEIRERILQDRELNILPENELKANLRLIA